MKVLKLFKCFLYLALFGRVWCKASGDASKDIETIKSLVMQIFQWYKNEMTTIRWDTFSQPPMGQTRLAKRVSFEPKLSKLKIPSVLELNSVLQYTVFD